MTSTTSEQPEPESPRRPPPSEPSRPTAILIVWMALVLALNAIRWVGGFPVGGVAEGVEQGVARAETQARGESTEEQIRKAIRSQRETVSFWTALAAIDDFLIEPLVLAGRAVLVATIFTGIAALTGRTLQYDQGLAESSRIQGLWVLGLAVRVALLVSLRRPEALVETSLALALPPGPQPAWLWMALRQMDVFALAGWTALAVSGWRRGEAAPAAALGVCAGLGLLEIAARTGVGVLIGGAMRLSLMVE